MQIVTAQIYKESLVHIPFLGLSLSLLHGDAFYSLVVLTLRPNFYFSFFFQMYSYLAKSLLQHHQFSSGKVRCKDNWKY